MYDFSRTRKRERILCNDVFKLIVNMALSEVDGIEKANKHMISKIKEGFRDGIEILEEENELLITIDVAIKYGLIVPKVVYELQKQIKEHLELFTGFVVKEVNVTVNQMIV
ncbi:MAG: Asp23/Gls24 family envelope stress response protein [Bacillaceae bacterium]|nr:Asp23/Gls24 family envelope stress response protein [Bacillaceae bacterium]